MEDFDPHTSQCTISITGTGVADSGMLTDILARVALCHAIIAETVVIFCPPAEKDGTKHYTMRVNYRSGGGITIGCLRRGNSEETEFHS